MKVELQNPSCLYLALENLNDIHMYGHVTGENSYFRVSWKAHCILTAHSDTNSALFL